MDITALNDEGFQVLVPFHDAEVMVGYVGLDQLRSIRQRATLRTWPTAGQRQGEPEESLDHAEAGRLLGRAAVRGWQGLTLEGEVYAYSPERCDLLMARWSEFARFVGEVSLDLAGLMERSMEQSKKKSMSTFAPEGISEGSAAAHART